MKILLVGSTGMLGSACSRILGEQHDVVCPSSQKLDVTKWDVVIETLDRVSPDVVINCAGYTDMDSCESEELQARKINVEGPRNLAQGCARFECRLVHLSSAYVFDGRKEIPQPYFEDDPPNPLSAYGKTKLDSEVAVGENVSNCLILRSGWVYDVAGRHFLRDVAMQALRNRGGIIRIPVDQMGSPTWSHRLALQVLELINSDRRGTYHATAEGYCTRLEYARTALELLGLEARLEGCALDEMQRTVELPLNGILENRRLKKQACNIMVDWKEDLETFVNAYGDIFLQQIHEALSSGLAA